MPRGPISTHQAEKSRATRRQRYTDSGIFFDVEEGEGMGETPQETSSDSSVAKAHARKRYFGLRPTLVVISVVNAFLLLGLFAYFSILMTYFTFTFDTQFPQETVPFYEAPASDAVHRQADRLHLWWWIVSLQLFRIFTVVGTHMAIAHGAVTGQRLPVRIMQWGTLLYGLIELAGLIFYLIVLFVPAKCAAVPVCRNWDSHKGEASEIAGQANWVFHLLTWGTLAYLAVAIAYFVVLIRANATLARAAASVKSARQGTKKS